MPAQKKNSFVGVVAPQGCGSHIGGCSIRHILVSPAGAKANAGKFKFQAPGLGREKLPASAPRTAECATGAMRPSQTSVFRRVTVNAVIVAWIAMRT